MTGTVLLRGFLRTGSLGALYVGMPSSDVLQLLGKAGTRIGGADPVYRYSGVEIYVHGETGLVWMLQMDPFRGRVELPPGLGAGDVLDVPQDRSELTGHLDDWGIGYELGEFHVPGQEDLRIAKSGVFVFFFDDGSVSSLSATRPVPGLALRATGERLSWWPYPGRSHWTCRGPGSGLDPRMPLRSSTRRQPRSGIPCPFASAGTRGRCLADANGVSWVALVRRVLWSR